MNLRNKILTLWSDKRYYVLGGKPTDTPGVDVYLVNVMDKPTDQPPEYSLVNIKSLEDKEELEIWPYKGDDEEALIRELLEDFLANAFSDDRTAHD